MGVQEGLPRKAPNRDGGSRKVGRAPYEEGSDGKEGSEGKPNWASVWWWRVSVIISMVMTTICLIVVPFMMMIMIIKSLLVYCYPKRKIK